MQKATPCCPRWIPYKRYKGQAFYIHVRHTYIYIYIGDQQQDCNMSTPTRLDQRRRIVERACGQASAYFASKWRSILGDVTRRVLVVFAKVGIAHHVV